MIGDFGIWKPSIYWFDRERVETMGKITLDIGLEAKGDLTRLGTRTRQDWTSVVKNALRLYHAALDEIDKGNAICLTDTKGRVKPWNVFD